ncbi:5-formyltetrahydrofolate cyclo-ligase [bacterium]|nr:5-formyltetrahydrofolate cyclo-ligase [bacterium]
MNKKSELRTKAKLIRKSLDIQNISQKLCEKIRLLEIYKTSKHIMLFYPLKYEINLLALLNDDKDFYLPKINGDNLEACPYKSGDTLQIGGFNTLEPTTKAVNPENLELIIIPALMADKNNYRLGYGKGYYDRFLPLTKAYTIVPIAKELVTDKLPTELHDKPVNSVIIE